MYNVGFGDCFLVTVRRAEGVWRMIVDCGTHRQGRTNSISAVVDTLIFDLTDEGKIHPHVDVVVATHHHEDHISGFALAAWENVSVGEVWLPFIEDDSDPSAQKLRQSQEETANILLRMINGITKNMQPGAWPHDMRCAQDFALNSSRNAMAADRLLGRNGKGFKGIHPTIRFLPSLDERNNVLPVGDGWGTIRILGPSRDPERIKSMNPPKRVGWLRLDGLRESESRQAGSETALFNPQYHVPSLSMTSELRAARKSISNKKMINEESILRAASMLERSINNTSLFFVLQVGMTKLLFPGDSQHGAWEHVLDDPESRTFLNDISLYKIGHHGSHNGTSKHFVEDIWAKGATAMLPWGFVKRWKDAIPKRELMDALEDHKHEVIRADSEVATDSERVKRDANNLWTEVCFPID